MFWEQLIIVSITYTLANIKNQKGLRQQGPPAAVIHVSFFGADTALALSARGRER